VRYNRRDNDRRQDAADRNYPNPAQLHLVAQKNSFFR